MAITISFGPKHFISNQQKYSLGIPKGGQDGALPPWKLE